MSSIYTPLKDLEIGDRFMTVRNFDLFKDRLADVWVITSKTWVEDRKQWDFSVTMEDDEESHQFSLDEDSAIRVYNL